MSVPGGEEHTITEMESMCALLVQELKEVIAEYDAPKFSDQCDDDEAKIEIKPSPVTADIAATSI